MKALTVVLLGCIFLYNCSPKSSQPEDVVQDTTSIDTAVVVNEPTADPAELATAQSLMERLQREFSESSGAMQKVVFEEQQEYEGRTTTYYFSDGELAYIYEDWAAEGGVGYSELTAVKSNPAMLLHLATEEPSFFICQISDGLYSFSIENAQTEQPSITGKTMQDGFPDYESGYGMMMSDIKSKLADFKKGEAWADHYLSLDSVDSEYGGKVAVYKRYRVDLSLWDTDILSNN